MHSSNPCIHSIQSLGLFFFQLMKWKLKCCFDSAIGKSKPGAVNRVWADISGWKLGEGKKPAWILTRILRENLTFKRFFFFYYFFFFSPTDIVICKATSEGHLFWHSRYQFKTHSYLTESFLSPSFLTPSPHPLLCSGSWNRLEMELFTSLKRWKGLVTKLHLPSWEHCTPLLCVLAWSF